ncbi:MAG: hypothetical protein QNK23_05035 [Crocinitomicaceae bacterium]|nr:hypothetical protein [Crocinitomicaceae bacterium]
MRDKEFSNIVSERFDGYGKAPSDAVWDNIVIDLDQDKKRRRIIIWWTVAALIGFTALAVNFSSWNFETGNSIAYIDDSEIEKNESAQEISLKDEPNGVKQNDSKLAEGLNNINATAVPHSNRTMTSLNELNSITLETPTNHTDSNENHTTAVVSPPKSDTNNRVPTKEFSIALLPYLGLSPFEIEESQRVDFIASTKIIISKWQIGIRATGFISTSGLNESNTVGIPTTYIISPEIIEPYYLSNHSSQRYAELEGYFLYNLRPRFELGAGISASYEQDRREYESWEFLTSHITAGIPIYARYNFLRKGKFGLTGELGLLNEYSYLSSSFTDNSEPTIAVDTSQTTLADAFSTIPPFNGHRYAFGLQGSIEASFQLSSKLTLTASIGYRNYLIERYSSNYTFSRNTQYLKGSIGVRWHFLH